MGNEARLVGRDWPEEIAETERVYREIEAARYRASGFEDGMRRRLAADPGLNREVRAAWSAVEAEILERFRSMIPTSPAEKGRGPKMFEVQREIAVGKECFLLRLDESGDPEEASCFTRRRLGLTGEVADFYAEAGLAAERAEPGPEPA